MKFYFYGYFLFLINNFLLLLNLILILIDFNIIASTGVFTIWKLTFILSIIKLSFDIVVNWNAEWDTSGLAGPHSRGPRFDSRWSKSMFSNFRNSYYSINIHACTGNNPLSCHALYPAFPGTHLNYLRFPSCCRISQPVRL